MAAGMALAVGLTLTALTAPAASADVEATGYNRCASPNFCLFKDVNGNGTVIGVRAEKDTLPRDMDNVTSSIWNRTGRLWSVYTGANQTGRCLAVAANYKGNITQYGINDDISSARPGGCS
jgi:hypothetical protein